MSRHRNPVEALVDALIDLFARITLALYVDLRVEGATHLPREGATVIAARHYHFLFEALALRRTAHGSGRFWTALDWTTARWQRFGMELLCHAARWPTVLRTDDHTQPQFARGASAYTLDEAQPMLRAATRQTVKLLRAGETLIIFPEAYTTVDIFPTPKADGLVYLPFRPGFVKLAQLAARDGKTQVSIVPTGLAYERLSGPRWPRWLPGRRPLWRITLRYGEALRIAPRATPAEVAALVARIEREARALSEPLSPAPAATPAAVTPLRTR
jgi:1-acyl-sn-glycerol-3-phosphate acyltransferase